MTCSLALAVSFLNKWPNSAEVERKRNLKTPIKTSRTPTSQVQQTRIYAIGRQEAGQGGRGRHNNINGVNIIPDPTRRSFTRSEWEALGRDDAGRTTLMFMRDRTHGRMRKS
jgi:hypothetical protein